MRVAQFIESLAAGGAEKLAVDIANELAARGHDSHLIVLNGEGPFRHRLASQVGYHDLKRPRQDGPSLSRLLYFAGTARRLAAEIRQSGINVLQTHLPKANFLGLTVGIRGLCRVHPTIHNNREFDYGDQASELRTFLRKKAYRQMLTSCGDMIAVSSQVRLGMIVELGLAQGPASHISVVTNGVPVPRAVTVEQRLAARAARGVGPDEFLIVGMGRLVPQKGFGSLLDALADWTPPMRPWRCIVAGDGELLHELENRVETLGLAGKVEFPGHEKDVAGLLAAADVFCLPSVYEGLPLALMEAMAAGLPVCSFAIDGVVELVSDGREGLLAAPQDAHGLGCNLQRLAADPDLCLALGKAGRALVVRNFSFRRVVDQLEEIYQV